MEKTSLLLSNPYLRIARDLAVIATVRMVDWAGALRTSDVGTKTAGNDLVTVADAQIEGLVRGYLRDLRPADVVVGEEGAPAQSLAELADGDFICNQLFTPPGACGEARTEQPTAWGANTRADGEDQGQLPAESLEWHVDPIDGTVNFVRGLEHYAFSVGIRDPHTDTWLAGLVAAPALNTLWCAAHGQGAFKHTPIPWQLQPGKTPGTVTSQRLTGTEPGRSGAVLATGFAYLAADRHQQLQRLEAAMSIFDDIRRAGSAAIDLCLAAEGRVNAYAERGPEIHDWAAGVVIAEEAGLQVRRGYPPGGVTIAADTAERYAHLAEHM